MEETNNNTTRINQQTGSESGASISNIIVGVVAVLVVVSAAQVFQMQGLLNAITNGTVKANAQTQGGATGLPSQVGGCG